MKVDPRGARRTAGGGYTRHQGDVYGSSKGRASGSKKWYRSVFSGGQWDQFIRGHAVGSVLQVCCGGSRLGFARVDLDPTVPGVNIVADMRHLPFRDEAFETVCCDPMYELGNDQRVHLQRELTRVAKSRVLFKAPWIMRATGWQLVETVLMGSHTCANVAVLSRLDRMHGVGLFPPPGLPESGDAVSSRLRSEQPMTTREKSSSSSSSSSAKVRAAGASPGPHPLDGNARADKS